MGTNFISRIIPLRTFHYYNGYRNADESVNLLQACYENPLFEEEGTVIGDTHTKIHGQSDALRTKQYDIHHPAQTSVHYRQSSPKRKKRLYILGVVIAVLAIIALVTVIIVSQRGDDDNEEKPETVLYRTQRVDGSIRIYKGPFSTFKPEYTDMTSEIYTLFASSFTYQMDYIFNHSADYSSSYSHSEIVNISSGSVVVEFVLRFRHAIDISHQSHSHIASVIRRGMVDSVFVINAQTLIIEPIDPALSVITTPKPGVCLPLFSMPCANVTTWSYTTFPNLLGHTGPHEVMVAESMNQELFHYACGKDFWCTVFNPKCHRSRALPPCRSYCKDVYATCGDKYHMTDIHALLDCDTLPDSENPDVCTPNPYKEDTCHPHEPGRCSGFGYSEVMFPNFAGHRNPYEAAEIIEVWTGINFATKCYRHSMLFTCAALMPECVRSPGASPKRIPPCKSLCNGFKAGCEIFMNVFFLAWPQPLYCDSLPDVDDPSVCIGYKEANEPIMVEECPIDETRCDNTTCIPHRWKCDDYQDCEDGSDERPLQTTLPLRTCAVCDDNQFRCTPKTTICLDNSRRCDGFEDCPTGSDERECVMLGDGGSLGLLTVYDPSVDAWQPVCWDDHPANFSDTVCQELGYMSAASVTSVTMTTTDAFTHVEPSNGTQPYLAQGGLKRGGMCSSRRMISITCGIPVCGIRPAYVPPAIRIVGGDLADPEAWPWQVSIHGGANLRYFCGGSIISDRWILTASHCIGGRTDTADILLRVGQPRRGTYSPYLQELHAKQLHPYPYYNEAMVDNDVALIETAEIIKFNDHVRPICLPPNSNAIPVGTRCTVIGWGKRNETALDYQRELKQVYLDIVDHEKCRIAIDGAERKVPYRLNEHMFCAGGGRDHDACSGDSGGPLLCPLSVMEDQWFTAGIVSWGVGCAYPNVPGVYTNLPLYLDWIRNTTGLPYL